MLRFGKAIMNKYKYIDKVLFRKVSISLSQNISILISNGRYACKSVLSDKIVLVTFKKDMERVFNFVTIRQMISIMRLE